MEREVDMMIAEDFFDEIERDGKIPVRGAKGRGKKQAKDFFAEVKVKMVMRIYGVTRVRALEIIAARKAELKAAEKSGDGAGKRARPDSVGKFLDADDLFSA